MCIPALITGWQVGILWFALLIRLELTSGPLVRVCVRGGKDNKIRILSARGKKGWMLGRHSTTSTPVIFLLAINNTRIPRLDCHAEVSYQDSQNFRTGRTREMLSLLFFTSEETKVSRSWKVKCLTLVHTGSENRTGNKTQII